MKKFSCLFSQYKSELPWGICSCPVPFLFLDISGLSEPDGEEGTGRKQTHFLGQGSLCTNRQDSSLAGGFCLLGRMWKLGREESLSE